MFLGHFKAKFGPGDEGWFFSILEDPSPHAPRFGIEPFFSTFFVTRYYSYIHKSTVLVGFNKQTIQEIPEFSISNYE